MALFSKKKTEKQEATADKQAEVKAKNTTAKTAVKKESSMKDLYQTEAKKKTVKTAKGKEKKVVAKTGQAYRILIRPLITEKVTALGALSKYVFEVAPNANKVEVAKAIKEVYGIEPSKVNILNNEGKRVRRGRVTGKRKDWKKAIITLPKGQSINVYEGV